MALFNLGGVYWNDRDFAEAAKVWKVATARFPDHDLAVQLRRDIPDLP